MRDGLKIPEFEPPEPIPAETYDGYWRRFIEELSRYVDEVTKIVTETNL